MLGAFNSQSALRPVCSRSAQTIGLLGSHPTDQVTWWIRDFLHFVGKLAMRRTVSDCISVPRDLADLRLFADRNRFESASLEEPCDGEYRRNQNVFRLLLDRSRGRVKQSEVDALNTDWPFQKWRARWMAAAFVGGFFCRVADKEWKPNGR